jgi:hypothetical protein
MKKHHIASLATAALLIAGTWAVAQSQAPVAVKPDPRIDRLLEQNDQIMKAQQDILKALTELKTDMTQLRRRSS